MEMGHCEATRRHRPARRSSRVALGATIAAALALGASSNLNADWWDWLPAGALSIETVSTKKDYVSGGDVLVRITVPDNVDPQGVRVFVGERNVSGSFGVSGNGRTLVGLVEGLPNGKSTISVSGRPWGATDVSLDVTNYPITGPIFAGPHQSPFFCQTEAFVQPDATRMGTALDANCSVNPRVHYIYRSTANAWRPMTSLASIPADAARTTTTAGVNVPFVVRVETRTVNRGIYQSALLHDPTTEPVPTPLSQPRAWNRKLVAIHGFGCPGGWYIQGAAQGSLPAPVPAEFLDVNRLGQGYAIFTNTLQHPSNNCNALVGAETAMMSKERFIEAYGEPQYTISHGCSGGSYTSTRYTDIVPGLFDGILISCTFPDPLSIAINGLDGHLLANYFSMAPGALTDPQIVAVTGFKSVRAFIDLANQAGRTDPTPGRVVRQGYTSAPFNAAVPASVRFHPVDNPKGARGTVFDWERVINGVDPATGFALRPFDNVGVQYGLRALNNGSITKTQFLDLNERIGGVDANGNHVASRSIGNAGAIRRSYQSGIQMSGGGGLASIPILDVSGIYNDDSGYHYQVFHFAARDRLAEMNGNADNYIMWRGNPVPYETAWNTLTSWIEAYKADTAPGTQREKVLRRKPAAAVDGCFNAQNQFIAEKQTLSSAPTTQCNTLFPSWELARIVAGGPVSLSNLKCQLKPVTPADYSVTFTAAELARLQRIFPNGVCDWSKPGVHQQPVVPFASFGPSPINLIDNTQP